MENHLEMPFQNLMNQILSATAHSLCCFPKSPLMHIQSYPITHVQWPCRFLPVLHPCSSGSFPLNANPFSNLQVQCLPQVLSLLSEPTFLSQSRKETSRQKSRVCMRLTLCVFLLWRLILLHLLLFGTWNCSLTYSAQFYCLQHERQLYLYYFLCQVQTQKSCLLFIVHSSSKSFPILTFTWLNTYISFFFFSFGYLKLYSIPIRLVVIFQKKPSIFG